MRSLLRDLARGTIAGAVATVPMSAVMLAAQKMGALPKQPPEEIMDSALDAADVEVDEETSNALATLNHFAFGAGCGAVYGTLRALTAHRGNGTAVGAIFALGVWFASYEGWVPKMTPLPRASDDRKDRRAVMAGAHVVYGATLGALASPTR